MDRPKDRVKGFYQKAVAVYDGKEWCVLSGPGIDAMRLGEYSPTAALAWDSARQRIGA